MIAEAELYDIRYPVKGCYIWMPYGMKLRRNVEAIIRRLLEEDGHQEVQFPTFIPEEFIRKESEHIKKFEEEIFWVVKGGKRELETRLALRPTSETAIMPVVKLWIKDYTDLPLKLYQIVSVFRAETKATHPLIRLREVTMFKEAHTVHATREDAEAQVRKAVEIYKRFFDELGIPYMINKRPEWDKFPGAVYTIAFDTIMPDGKALQIGTVHYLGQNFAKVFDVKYLTPEGKTEYAHTTSYGISERVIATILAYHSDDRGLILPPNIAPIKIVVIPIYYSDEQKEKVMKYIDEVKKLLEDAGYKLEVDVREKKTPGWKFYYWEMKGVPIRLEIGPRDAEARKVVVVRRDTLKKESVELEKLIEKVKELERDILKNLRERAWNWMKSRIKRCSTLEEAAKAIEEGNVVEVPVCGSEKCEMALAEKLDADVLGEPLDDISKGVESGEKCVVCGREAKVVLRVAKRY